MKKFLLLAVMLLGMGGIMNAQDETNLTEITQENVETGFTAATKTDGEGYTTYTATGTLQFAIKTLDVDVTGCDYVIIKFAEGVPQGWVVAFWNDNTTESIPTGATEYKLTFAQDPHPDKRTSANTLDQITLMTTPFGTVDNPSVVKVIGVYKHTEVQSTDTEDPGVSKVPENWTSVITNGDLSGTDVSSFWTKEPDPAVAQAAVISNDGRMGGKGLKVVCENNSTVSWDKQFFIKSNVALPNGAKMHIEFDYRADKAATVSTQVHRETPGSWISNNGVGDIAFGLNWNHFSTDFNIKDEEVRCIAFNLNEGQEENSFYFDNISLWIYENPIKAGVYDATDAMEFDIADFKTIGNGATWDADTKTLTGIGGFQWEEGLDFDHYRYLVITSGKNVRDGNRWVAIKDGNGKTVQGNDYGHDFMNMWFSEWNNHNCLRIDMEKLRLLNEFNIHDIRELSIEGESGFMLGNVYATNQIPGNNKEWNGEDEGDFKVGSLPVDKFGTICLPWKAAVAGAFVYEIVGATDTEIDLARVDGLMEAGKPYFYKTNADDKNVYFYKATAATVTSPVPNNGMVGTFDAMSAVPQGENIYVLSNNTLYNVDSEVSLAKNKAYVDLSQVNASDATSKARISISFNEATGIKNIDAAKKIANKKIYDLMGREVKQPTRGLYIIDGKKVMIK